ncbi:MAG: hypothetical protein ABIM36_04410 [candidate division WOR-3 bacterium]
MSDRKAIFFLFLFLIFLYIFKNFLSLKYFIIGFSLFAIIIFAIYWKKSLIFLLYWILIEGAFRKWIFPFMQKEIFMLKFLILFSIYFGYLRDKKIKGENPLPPSFLTFLIILYSLYGMFQIFNPNIENILIGIIGFIVEFSPVFLIFIVKEIFDTEERVYKFIKNYVFFSLPIIILGFIQYNLPYNHILNYYAHGVPADAFVGKGVRPSSTFPYISGYAQYLHVIGIFSIFFLTIFELNFFEKIYVFIIFILLNLSIFLTGSRFLFGALLFSYLVYLLILLINSKTRKSSFTFIFSLFLSSLLLFFTPFGKKAYENFLARAAGKGVEEIKWRIKIGYVEPFGFGEHGGLFGYGTGMSYQGVSFLREKELNISGMPTSFEPEAGRIVLEYGIFGLFIVSFLRIMIMILLFKHFTLFKDYKLKYFCLLILLYLLPGGIFLHQINFQSLPNIYFWFFSGFLFLFDKFEKNKINITKYEVER